MLSTLIELMDRCGVVLLGVVLLVVLLMVLLVVLLVVLLGLEHTQLVHARFHEFYFIPY